MNKKWIPALGITALLLLGLTGCGEQITEEIQETARDFLMEHGQEVNQAIDDGLEAIKEYGVLGQTYSFENEAEARSYLLDSLEQRYGIQFIIVEQRAYDQYGPIYGDVYTVDAAPADSPEQIFAARAMQSGAVSDCYWQVIFQDVMQKDLEGPLCTICEGKEYVQSFSTEVRGSYTEQAWRADDALQRQRPTSRCISY